MKISLNWIKQYVDISLPPKEVADRLTMAGSEVKGLQVIGESWDSIVVGRITAVNPHPNADRLTLVTIDHGSGEETVVCGAPNVAVGVKVAFAPVGARLIDPHTGEPVKLKRAKIRGVVSSGMACSEKELGISEEHEGILILPEEVEVSRPLADYLGDVILNMDVTPNRPDCLAIIGIAREVAALTGQSVHLPDAGYKETDTPIESKVSVEIMAPDLCPRYCASLITGVKLGESPKWMQERLISYGMRPISNIVDVTNFVMLEYGQPLHAFDYEEITGRKIIVRRAAEGEVIISLDGEERTLSRDMLVIADKERAVAVAGVMGGANSEVSQFTTTILLEAASFNPRSIHYTGRILGMPSEACMRFERGISPELAMPALKRATQLIAELGGGQAASGVIDVYPGKAEPETVVVSTDVVKRVLGVGFSREQIEETLISLGFECRAGTSESEVVAVAPYWRSDIRLPVDLVEEVARIIGYDEIPTTMLNEPIPPHNPEPIVVFKRRLSQYLVGFGFQEIVSHPWASQESLRKLLPQSQAPESAILRLVNPMTIDQTYLRPSLRGNVLTALAANRGHIDGGIRLYELGRVFRPRSNDLPDESEMLCGLLSGPRHASSWLGDAESVDFFDAKGVVEGLLARLGVAASFEAGTDESLHPSNQAAIISNDARLGVVGQLHPVVKDAFEIPEPAFLFELSLPALLPLTLAGKMFEPISRFPAVVRDMALVVDAATIHQKVVDIIGGFPLVEDVALFDVYSGEQVPSGKKSLAYHISYRSPDHTLTDDEVSKFQQRILKRLSGELGAVLRE
jgi:phenylalanyl-tRNA synthetase beta chain